MRPCTKCKQLNCCCNTYLCNTFPLQNFAESVRNRVLTPGDGSIVVNNLFNNQLPTNANCSIRNEYFKL